MGNKVTNAALLEACEALIDEGADYDEMDCQAAVEEALERAGMDAKTVNLAGSNAHYRRCKWTGTPERLIELIGTKTVPAGVFMFIVADDGNEPAKYQGDGYGNASHMGIYMGSGRTFNSSETNGGVCASTKFNGKKAVPNGGWNMAGISEWVDLGLSDDQIAAIEGDANYSGSTEANADDDSGSSDNALALAKQMQGYIDEHMVIKRKCKGGAVRCLQKVLTACGYDLRSAEDREDDPDNAQAGIDGDFGGQTENGVIYFQKTHDLEADGVVGPLTWAALIEDYNTAMDSAEG